MPANQSDDDAFDRLAQEFPRVPRRIVAVIVQSHLNRVGSFSAAVSAARVRLHDACSVA